MYVIAMTKVQSKSRQVLYVLVAWLEGVPYVKNVRFYVWLVYRQNRNSLVANEGGIGKISRDASIAT